LKWGEQLVRFYDFPNKTNLRNPKITSYNFRQTMIWSLLAEKLFMMKLLKWIPYKRKPDPYNYRGREFFKLKLVLRMPEWKSILDQ